VSSDGWEQSGWRTGIEYSTAIVARLESIDGVHLDVSDCTFRVHLGGKIEVSGRAPVKTRDDRSAE
jgi:malate dehydrogenase (oxaloacetate-decarboxylating)